MIGFVYCQRLILVYPRRIQHLRLFRTERFGVISEFAQNGTAGFATAYIKGFDTRVRYKISPSVWVGARYSQLDTITGTAERSHRFRIETAATF